MPVLKGGFELSVVSPNIEHVFDDMSDAEVVDAISAEARASAAADSRRYAAIAELQRRRCADADERRSWACDDWDGAAAEVAAALNVGHGRASREMDLAIMLRDRFPGLAALFGAGLLNGRRVWLVNQRTELVTDPEALKLLDAVLVERIVAWGALSEYKLTLLLDVEVQRIDPDAVRRVKSKLRDRASSSPTTTIQAPPPSGAARRSPVRRSHVSA